MENGPTDNFDLDYRFEYVITWAGKVTRGKRIIHTSCSFASQRKRGRCFATGVKMLLSDEKGEDGGEGGDGEFHRLFSPTLTITYNEPLPCGQRTHSASAWKQLNDRQFTPFSALFSVILSVLSPR